jgi:pimeloyl-ACP methyl ester carboxylesterase
MVTIWILAGIVLAGGMAALLFGIHRGRRQRQLAAAVRIQSPNGIDEGRFVKLGGIEQWIRIRGEDRRNPVILVMHGGPATSYMAFAQWFRPWERHFTVVQWDRRGVGKTFGRNGRSGSGEMTLERIIADGGELCEFLRRHLQKKKILLLGHSMGSMIGVSMAARHPDLLYAYVGTEQLIDMPRNESVSYRIILDRVRKLGDLKTTKALERLGPPPYAKPRDWGTKQYAAEAADTAYGARSHQAKDLVRYSPEYSVKDLFDLVNGALFCISKLYGEWMRFDAHRLGAQFKTPVFIIQGDEDVMTPTQLAREWVEGIEAPRKAFIPIEGGCHLVMVTAADAYLAALLQHVRPLAEET